MVLNAITRRVGENVEYMGSLVNETLFETTIRLGVTGLARSGKTVFLTSLVSNLLSRERLVQFEPAMNGRIEAAVLRPQPDDTIARFEYERFLSDLTVAPTKWPSNTRAISEMRISMKVRPKGMLGALRGAGVVHLDLVDYPGEWLLDLGLLNKSYEEWSHQVLTRMASRTFASEALRTLSEIDHMAERDEEKAKHLADIFTAYLRAAQERGLSDLSPGRFLLPGDLAGSPVLTFGPLPAARGASRNSLYREMSRRFEAYKTKVVRPFFRDHFAKLDRQIVLIDVLSALNGGPAALEDMHQSLADIMMSFRTGRNDFLSRLLRGKRIDRLLFAATKADHLHHTQHSAMTRSVEAIVAEAQRRADFAGATASSTTLAALRTTTESQISQDGKNRPCVVGEIAPDRKRVAYSPGDLPQNPEALLRQKDDSAHIWKSLNFATYDFLPSEATQSGAIPHIRMDHALQFLLGDLM